MTTKLQYEEAYEAALVNARELKAENDRLRELVDLYEWGLAHEGTPINKLIWSRKVDRLREEVGLG